jgi:hypothetical protein
MSGVRSKWHIYTNVHNMDRNSSWSNCDHWSESIARMCWTHGLKTTSKHADRSLESRNGHFRVHPRSDLFLWSDWVTSGMIYAAHSQWTKPSNFLSHEYILIYGLPFQWQNAQKKDALSCAHNTYITQLSTWWQYPSPSRKYYHLHTVKEQVMVHHAHSLV